MEKEKQINQMKLDFFTNVSHEFRTPLSLIKAPVEKLMQTETNPDKIDQYRFIHKHTLSLNKLIDEILDFRKIDTGKMQLELQHFDLIAFLQQIIGSYSSMAEKNKIRLTFNSMCNSLLIWLDKNKTEKIITNILSNAFKYTPANGYITICANLKGPAAKGMNKEHVEDEKILLNSAVVIMISDSGTGIPPEYIQNIFKPFYQLPGTKYGTGIGLSLAHEFAKLQKGDILASSVPGKGSTFYIGLPVDLNIHFPDKIIETKLAADKTYEQINYEIEDIGIPEPIISDKKPELEQKPSILIIEDYKDILTFLKNELKDIYEVDTANNGEQGYKMAIERQYDLILSDIMMPRMDGIELCQKLKNDEKTSHIPVILLTAKASIDNKIEGLQIGADDYIIKPFHVEELKARIKNLILQRQKLRERFTKEIISLEPKDIATNAKDEKFMKRAYEIVEKNLSDPEFCVSVFTNKMGLSRSIIHTKIKYLTNQTTSEFITFLRLKKAVQIIKSTNKTISEVCYETGFNDYAYFNRRFKKLFGKSPKEYFSN